MFYFPLQFIVAVVMLAFAAVNTNASLLPFAYHAAPYGLPYAYAPQISLSQGLAAYNAPAFVSAYQVHAAPAA